MPGKQGDPLEVAPRVSEEGRDEPLEALCRLRQATGDSACKMAIRETVRGAIRKEFSGAGRAEEEPALETQQQTVRLRNKCRTEIQEGVRAINLVMREYGAEFVDDRRNNESGFARFEETLNDFFVARSNDQQKVEHHQMKPGETFCGDHGRLMACLAAPGNIFTQNEREIAACIGHAMLGKAGFQTKLDHHKWLTEIEEASNQATATHWSLNQTENVAVEYAEAIQRNWRWLGFQRHNCVGDDKMANYPSFSIEIDLGQSVSVKGGADPAGAARGDVKLGGRPSPDVVAEVLFKLGFAVLKGDVSIPLKLSGSTIVRDNSYKAPTNPNDGVSRRRG
jgi:hypothetical protein